MWNLKKANKINWPKKQLKGRGLHMQLVAWAKKQFKVDKTLDQATTSKMLKRRREEKSQINNVKSQRRVQSFRLVYGLKGIFGAVTDLIGIYQEFKKAFYLWISQCEA